MADDSAWTFARTKGQLVLTLTCHSCEETMQAESEEELVDLGLQHAEKHDHVPPREHVLVRIRHQNR